MIFITTSHTLVASPQQVKAALLDHAALGRFFNAKFLLVKPQNNDEEPGGVGAIRQVSMAGVTFKEQIVAVNKHHICYQIIGNKPVAKHKGDIYFFAVNSTPVRCQVSYSIRCKAPWWLPNSVLEFFIKRDVVNALKKLNNYFLGEQNEC